MRVGAPAPELQVGAPPERPRQLAAAQVGKNLTDTTGSDLSGQIPALESLPPYNEDGTGGMHIYMPWWLDNQKLDFPRGYHIEPYGGRGMPGAWFMGGIQELNGGGYGKGLKADYRRFYGSTVGFSGRGEMVPNKDCYCEVDPEVVDKWGIPVLRFHWKWSDYEINQAKHMQETFRQIVEGMGGKAMGKPHGPEDNYDIEDRRRDHPRGGHHAHGRQPRDLGAGQELPGPRVQERVRGGQRSLREQRPQEHDLDHPRPLHAHERAHRRASSRRATCEGCRMPAVARPKVYDVCIVGSGAGGGMAAKVLTEAGADCVMLEAGPKWSVEEYGTMFKWNYESPRRGGGHRGRPFGELDSCLGGWDIPGEPYTVAEGSEFSWFRGRMLGGRTNHWGRIALRFGPWDFKGRSRDGLGDDWPFGYEEVKPYYDRLDQLVGLFGSNEGLENDPDGIFLPPPAPRAYELLVKKACDRLKVTCIPSRIAILTKPHGGRAACHYCSQCGRGCNSHSFFTTPTVLLPPALATGKLGPAHRGHGARGHDQRRGPLHRRHLHRHRHRPVRDRAREGGGAGRECLRVGSHPAELASRRGSRTASPTEAARWAAT